MEMNISKDSLLDGKVTLCQSIDGYRVSSDSIFLAASVPFMHSDTILDVGAGTGAIVLCLSFRSRNIRLTAIEKNSSNLLLLKRNIDLNNKNNQISVLKHDITKKTEKVNKNSFNHVVSNPPFWKKGEARLPANQDRLMSLHETNCTLKEWIYICSEFVSAKGSFSIILPVNRYDEAIEAISKKMSYIRVLPMLSRIGNQPKRLIIQAWSIKIKKIEIYEPLVLHEGIEGDYTDEANRILRHGSGLDISKPLALVRQYS